MLHPVVGIDAQDKVSLHTLLEKEIETRRKEVKEKEPPLKDEINQRLRRHKIAIRNHILHIRDNLREEFDDFFNNLLQSIRKDWNLFSL